jgi:hypothetical protein
MRYGWIFWEESSYWIFSENETLLWWRNRFFRGSLFDKELIDEWRDSLVGIFVSSIEISDVRLFVDGENVFLTLSNIALNESFVSISITSSDVDADTDSSCVRNDGEIDSWSDGVWVVDDGRLRSRFNASNGRAKKQILKVCWH